MASTKNDHNSKVELILNNPIDPSDSCSSVEDGSVNNSMSDVHYDVPNVHLEKNDAPTVTKDAVKVNRKYEKRLEKQLEINMTPKMTLLENSSPEGSSPNTSRYGRARKLKTDVDFYPTDVALHMRSRMSKSPSKSPKKSLSKLPDVSPTNIELHVKSRISKSPSKSPKQSVPKLPEISPTLQHVAVPKSNEEDSNLIDKKPTVETKLIHTPWIKQLDKKPLKVYVRKDLIQKKTNEESCSLITNIFSFSSPLYDTFEVARTSADTPEKEAVNEEVINSKSPSAKTKPSPRKSLSLKNVNKTPKGNKNKTSKQSIKEGTPTESKNVSKLNDSTEVQLPQGNKIQFNMTNSSSDNANEGVSDGNNKVVVATGDSNGKQKNTHPSSCKLDKRGKQFRMQLNLNDESPDKLQVVQTETQIQAEYGEASQGGDHMDGVEVEVNEDEKTCKWKLDELLWARVGTHPFWPCLVTRDPHSWRFVRKKKVGRSLIPVEVYHVTFFGDSGRRSWLLANCLIKFEGLNHFNRTREELTPEIKKKDPKYCAAFEIRENKKDVWLTGVQEAEMLMSRPPELREEFFVTMYLSKLSNKSPTKGKKKMKTKADKKNADISLSDFMFDSLFNVNEDKQTGGKNSNLDLAASSSEPKKSVGVIDFLDNNLDTLAAKTGNEKIMVQSHMERWLLKFKKPLSDLNNSVDNNSVQTVIDGVDESLKNSSSFIKNNLGPKTASVANNNATAESDLPNKKKYAPKRRKTITHSSEVDISQLDATNNTAKTATAATQRRRKSVAAFELEESNEETKINSLDQTSIKQPSHSSSSRTRKSVVNSVSECTSLNNVSIVSSESSDTSISKICTSKQGKSTVNYVTEINSGPLDTGICKITPSRRRKSIVNDVRVVSDEPLETSISKICTSKQGKSTENYVTEINNGPLDTGICKITPSRRRKSIVNDVRVVSDEPCDTSETFISHHKESVTSSAESLRNTDLLDTRNTKDAVESVEPSIANNKSPTQRRKSIACTSVLQTEDEKLIVDDCASSAVSASRRSTLRRRKTVDSRNIKVDLNCSNYDTVEELIHSKTKFTEEENEKEELNILTKPTTSTPKVLMHRRRKSVAVSPRIQIAQPESDFEHVEEKIIEDKKNKVSPKYGDPEFQEFLEFKRDALLEENPNLTEEYVISYLYKTWQYGESKKTDDMKSADDYCLVKGMADEPTLPENKKQRKRNKDTCEIEDNDSKLTTPIICRENSRRKTNIKSYFVKDSDSSDVEDLEISVNSQQIEAVQQKADEPIEAISENIDVTKLDAKSSKKSKEICQQETEENVQIEVIENSLVDYYMESLKIDKPNIFKGLIKEKVCVICEKPRRLTKCMGSCGEMYHIECIMKRQAKPTSDGSGRYKKKRKRGRKTKNTSSNEHESGEESQLDDTNDNTTVLVKDDNGSEVSVVKPALNGDVELCVSHSKDNQLHVPKTIVTDAKDFEYQLERTMKEMLNNGSPDSDLDISSTSMDVDNEWSGVKAGDCVIVDVVEHKVSETNTNSSNVIGTDTFKCSDCIKGQVPLCFACKSTLCVKNNSEKRQKCNVPHCNKYYHIECLQTWPQTKYSTTCPTKNQKKTQVLETLSCPRHVCHTCVSDDPRGNRTRFTSDKLARCVRCPATYHSLTKCVPAGTKLLTASHIVCPRHNDDKVSKIPYHVNTAWCFICAKGGSLICCETCPTSFHAECLKISPPEGSYICEECETGRLPLYEELVWVKLGHYRWWPALVLHPSDVPPNIVALSHASNQFAVRFFGDYDHFWVNSGRVFPYQEDDTGRASSRKSAVDNRFLTALKQAKEAYNIIKNLKKQEAEEDELSSSVLPPQYVKLKVNRPVGGAAVNYKNDKTCAQKCECDPNSSNPCAPDSDCINRMLQFECSPSVCAAGERCCNQAFEKRQYPPLQPSRTQHRGWGLKTCADIKKGDFVIEYVGEVIDEAEFQRRMTRKREVRDENYYFLTIEKDRMIDAGPKGNVARFMNHSCEPNCETQKWTVNGDTRVGLFALQDIPSGSEVTFNYNLMCADDDKKKCMCGAKRCAGFIGAKLIQDEVTPKNPKKSNVKRKYNKRSLDNMQTKSPSAAKSINTKSPSLSGRKRKSLPSNKSVEEDGIDKDWKEINQAVTLVDDREKKGKEVTLVKVDKLDSSSKESKKENLPCVETTLLNSTCVDSSSDKSVENSCNGFEKEFAQFIQNNDRNANVGTGGKRKYSPNSSAISKNKRARSNSVHFSNNVTCIESNGVGVKYPLPRLNRTYTIDSDFPRFGETCDTTSPKGKRGRPRKSAVQNEI